MLFFAFVACDSDSSADVPKGSLNLVYFGNSLVRGFGFFGVAASSDQNDYSALVNQHFTSLGYEVNGVRTTAGIYEKLLSKEDQDSLLNEYFYPYLDKSTDFVVVQFGDNVTEQAMLDVFAPSVGRIVDEVRARVSSEAEIILVSSWYSSEIVDRAREGIRQTAKEKNVPFIDISDLNTVENQSHLGAVITHPEKASYSAAYESFSVDSGKVTLSFNVAGKAYTSTFAAEEYSVDSLKKEITWEGYESVVVDPDVASHPGDQGFKLIADRIIKEIEKHLK